MDEVLKQILEKLDNMEKEQKALRVEMNERFNSIDERFDQIDKRFDILELKLDHAMIEFRSQDKMLEARIERLESIINLHKLQ